MGARSIAITHSEALELVSMMLGFSDWNTLSAFISTGRSHSAQAKPINYSGVAMPVIPMKDWVPFPTLQMPLFIKRPKTVQALSQAFSQRRELVVVAQKSQTVEEPSAEDVYDVGVVARVLDVGPPSDKVIAHKPALEGATQVLVQTQGRVAIRKFSGQVGRYEAEIEHIDEGNIPAAPDLIEKAVARFDSYAEDRKIAVSGIWPPLHQLHDPGRVADLIAQRLPTALEDKQAVLATFDPVARLELVVAQMGT
jgi:ATP-dependent Lon protease